MNFDLEQLQTLVAVVDAGSFEDASVDLGITASAVSQRIKALETRVGAILLVRSRPVRPTERGSRMLGFARQITLLGHELSVSLRDPEAPAKSAAITVGVNADSLAGWFAPVFSSLAQLGNLACEFIRSDEHQSARLLQEGKVGGVVTTRADAIQGCTSQPLGIMRYRAAAAKTLLAQWTDGTVSANDLVKLPVVNFDREDPLQRDLLSRVTGERSWGNVPVHYVPDSWQFVTAIDSGMGWGMVPENQLDKLPNLQVLNPDWQVDVPLYWQRWSVISPALRDFGKLLSSAAMDAGLYPIEQ